MHVKVFSTTVSQDNTIAMSIIPVIVWHRDSPEKERKVYAVIDNCSQGTFGSEDLLLYDMEVPARKTSLTIETAIGTETVDTYTIDNLYVRCTEKHKTMYPESPNIKLPRTFTRSTLPAGKGDIAIKESVSYWSHLKRIAHKLPEFDTDIPIGLLIGLNCPRAQEPHETVLGKEDSPYAIRNALGWCVMGPIGRNYESPVKCNRIKTHIPFKDVSQNKNCKHHFIINENMKDNFIKDRLQEMYATEFSERKAEDQAMSHEDMKFMELMNREIVLKNGKYELPLPFRNSNPQFPESRQQARARLRSVKRKMTNNRKFCQDYYRFHGGNH